MKFEDNMKQLEAVIRKMESGNISLDEMIKAFEEGKALVDKCREDLEAVRVKIERVSKEGIKEIERTEDGDIKL